MLRTNQPPLDCKTTDDHFTEWLRIASKPRSALLIDDSFTDTDLIVSMSRGFNILWETAYEGLESIEKISQKKFQLIVLDLNLGKPPDGVNLFKAIKRVCPLCPVLILSSHITNEVIVEVTKVGFAMFAQKPFVFDSDFFDQLFSALNIPRSNQNAA